MRTRGVLRPTIARLPVFPGIPTADRPGRPDMALLHLNECPYPPSPKVVAAIVEHAAGLNRYAESRPQRLADLLAERAGHPPAQIVIGNGSDELLALISLIALEPGDSAVMPTPSFPRYRLAAVIQGATPRLARLAPEGSNDVDALLAAIDASTRIVYACSPNNPSGAPLPEAELERLATSVPQDVLLVVDEAYAEFNTFEGGHDALAALAKRKGPWISTRTFSKAYALAGLRLGYALTSSTEIAEALVKVKLNFNLNRLAVHAGIAALEDAAHAERAIGAAIAERRRIAGKLGELGLPCLSSRANFLSFDIGRNAVPVMAAMAEAGVLVREWRDPGFDTFIRLTIGLPEENDRAVTALAQALASG